MRTIFEVLARGENCTNVHLLIAGVQRAGLDVHDISRADVLGCEVSPANAHCSGTGNGYHVFAQSHGRSLHAVGLAGGRRSSSMVTSLSWQSAIVEFLVLDASFKFAGGVFLGFRRAMVNCTRALGEIRCLCRSEWSLRWIDVCN